MALRNKGLVKTVQVILGLVLLFFGLNGFIGFMALPEMNQQALGFVNSLFAVGYIFPILNVIFILTGLLFLFDRCVAFGAILIFPLTFNIALFHIFLEINNSLMGFVVFVLNLYLIYSYFDSYRGMCR
ncbi:hypothetical protein CMI42_01370 [Candidatus Pacearchaeota archaeon]|nr:hypothetical protein [Candidatus Pacearchaeota archaeon]|tara:strand:- start:1716 stop:2099 length:384 start_codon:yes stop_codon:yes gene_type:complete